MKRMTDKGSMLLLCLSELVVGILLLVNPAGFTTGILLAAGWLLMLLGAWLILRYFLMKPEEAAVRQLMFRGLCALLLGLFCVVNVEWVLSVFPFLAMLYGLCVLLIGLRRIQWTVDMIRLKKGRWYWPAIGAALALVVAAVILLNPFTVTVALWVFTGVALIVEAVVDGLTLLFTWLKERQEKKERTAPKEAANSTASET